MPKININFLNYQANTALKLRKWQNLTLTFN
jgi:hypothetical protein